MEHGIDALLAGYLDRAGGKSSVPIGIVGTLHLQVGVVDTTQGKVLQGKLHRRVSLKGHTTVQTVEVHTSDVGFLSVISRFFIYDASQGTHLLGRKSMVGCQLSTVLTIPEPVVLALHTFHKRIGRDIPVDLVGVWHKEAGCQRVANDKRCYVRASVTRMLFFVFDARYAFRDGGHGKGQNGEHDRRARGSRQPEHL